LVELSVHYGYNVLDWIQHFMINVQGINKPCREQDWLVWGFNPSYYSIRVKPQKLCGDHMILVW